MNRSIAIKIIIPVAAVFAMAVVVSVYFLLRAHSITLVEKTRQTNVFWGNMIASRFERSMLTGKPEDVKDLLSDLAQSPDIIAINIEDRSRIVRYSTHDELVGKKAFASEISAEESEEVVEKPGADPYFRVTRNFINKKDCRTCHDEPADAVLGTLEIEMSLRDMAREIESGYAMVLPIAAGVLVIVSLFLTFVVIYLIKRPMSALIRAVDSVGGGNLATRIKVGPRDEIGVLAERFNYMVESLEKAKREITRQHESAMFQAEKLASIGEIALGVAHEIKNPLASIASAVQVISKSPTLDKKYERVVDELLNQIKRMDKTIKDLLHFARPSEPKFVRGSVVDVLERAVLFIKTQAESQRVSIETEFDPAASQPILLDPELLQQAFLNIMLNSVQAMPEGGLIRVQAMPGAEGQVLVILSDTGKGIPEAIAEKIFSPFFTTKAQGTGLGLFICKNIIAKHQAKISLERKFGTGCTFKIVLTAVNKGEQFE